MLANSAKSVSVHFTCSNKIFPCLIDKDETLIQFKMKILRRLHDSVPEAFPPTMYTPYDHTSISVANSKFRSLNTDDDLHREIASHPQVRAVFHKTIFARRH